MRKIRCKVCENKFDITKIKSKIYQIKTETLSGATINLDTIDCPKCGCQIILKERFLRK